MKKITVLLFTLLIALNINAQFKEVQPKSVKKFNYTAGAIVASGVFNITLQKVLSNRTNLPDYACKIGASIGSALLMTGLNATIEAGNKNYTKKDRFNFTEGAIIGNVFAVAFSFNINFKK